MRIRLVLSALFLLPSIGTSQPPRSRDCGRNVPRRRRVTHFDAPKPRPGDDQHGMLPDIAVNRELLIPYQAEADPVLAFALAHIRKSRENPRR